MRRVGLSDLDVATRALLARPRPEWAQFASGMIEEAHRADIWRERTGSAYPAGGTGSLYAQAALHPCVPASECEAEYCAALAQILYALDTWRNREMGTVETMSAKAAKESEDHTQKNA